jgi:deoxyribonuclease-4
LQGIGPRMLEGLMKHGQGERPARYSAPIGSHVSTSGGIHRAPTRARESGGDALQIFTSPPQRWAAAAIGDDEAAEFRRSAAAEGIRATVAHDSYLINLATERADLLARSAAAFRAELERACLLGLDYLVTHPGNATGGDRGAALRQNARAVGEAIEQTEGITTVLFETTAGTGTALGWRFEELAALLDAVPVAQSSRVGVCLDTAHVFAAGYDLRADPAAVLDEFDRQIGLERLLLFHLNDSVGELASRRDRHANIGEGRIGSSAFGALLSDERVSGVPGVLETPKGDDPLESDRRNLAVLRESVLAAAGH